MPIEMKCKQCDDNFLVPLCRSKGKKKACFCSMSCSADSLRKYPVIKFNGVTYYKNPNDGYYHSKQKRSLHRDKWKHYRGHIPDGYVIHHKDGNKINNNMKNLELMSRPQHTAHHRAGEIERKCLLEGCNKKHWAKGHCRKHYEQSRRQLKLKGKK